MAMSKSCYNGCYNRRSCYNHGCCNQQSSGVSTGSLLAAGVAASLLVLALDCDDTTATTTTCTATAVGLADPFGYVLPGVASDDKTALQRASARQPLGLFGDPTTNMTGLTTATSIITYGFTTMAPSAAAVFSTTANMVGVINTPMNTAFTTAADLVNAYQISLNLAPLFGAVTADLNYTALTAANVAAFFATAGLNMADIAYSVHVNFESLQRFVSGVGATDSTAPFLTAGSSFPALTGAVTVGAVDNVPNALYGTTGFNGVQNLYGSTSIDASEAASIGTISLFQTSARYTTNLTTYVGITPPATAEYTPVSVVKNGLDTAYRVQFTVKEITDAVATGTTAYAVRFLAWRSTYTPSVINIMAGLASTPTSALTFLQNSTTAANGQTQAVTYAMGNAGVGTLGNVAIVLQIAFQYKFQTPSVGFFARTGSTTNNVYAYSGGATTRGQSGGAIANTDTQVSLASGADLQGCAIVQIASGPTA